MLFLLLTNYFVYVILAATDTDVPGKVENDRNGPSRSELLSEITNLRQLVNQESLYRQELERQVREFRQQLFNGYPSDQIETRRDAWNAVCNTSFSSVITLLESITRRLDAKTLQLENITHIANGLDDRITRVEDMVTDTIIGMLYNLSLGMLEVKESLEKQSSHKSRNIDKVNNDNVLESLDTTKGKNKSETYDKGHMGKRFAIMVPPGKSKRYRPIQLIISSESNTQISMKSTYPGLIKVFNITPPGKNISIPLDLALSQSGIRLQSRGIILESTEYVSVYVFNEDGYFALPARYLGTYYKSMTTDHGRSFIAIMPYGGSARVQITSTKGISSRNITIPELWVYSFWSSSVFRNVIISSNQTIAVISGHYDPHKVNMKISKQILFDYIPPVQSWDTSFIIPYIQNTTFKYDFLYTTSTTKIYAIRNFTTSQETITLPYKYVRSDKYVSNFIETVQGKMAVVLWYYWGTVLNTFMCVIPSLSQFSNNYHFWTPFYANNNFLAAIIKEEDLPGLIVDNSNVSNPYMSHSVLTLDEVKYNILTIAVTHGWHAVRHVDPGVRFGLIMYGGDLNISYGLPLGLRMD